MIAGKVTGSVIATRKNENLVGNKFLIVKPLEDMCAGHLTTATGGSFIAIDNVGAGIGEIVLVSFGSAARIGCGLENSPIDAAIVGIIDTNQ